MVLNKIVGSATRYLTSLSVSAMDGTKKVTLQEADKNKKITGAEVEIDATEEVEVKHSKNLMQYTSESFGTYMDGTVLNPKGMSIKGIIESTKLQALEELFNKQTWVYVVLNKDMGGAAVSNDGFADKQKLIKIYKRWRDGVAVQSMYANATLYVLRDLTIREVGFKNVVEIDVQLEEVKLFRYNVSYRLGSIHSPQAHGASEKQNVEGEIVQESDALYKPSHVKGEKE